MFVIGLINSEAYATGETDQIRQECAMQIQSYGISDSEAYQLVLNDRIVSMSTANPLEQCERENLPPDQA